MGKEILNLEPREPWANFYELTQVPRPSKKEDQVRQFIVGFGTSLGLETVVDEAGNVIICKPATPGMENRKSVILQGHLDMVPQKNNDTVHDFENDPIDAYIDGEWVKAKGTTLGADNGIGVAAIMAVLESTTIKHGPIEALFTVDEETGMTGASGLKPGLLEGKILLNLDSEEEGELFIGCAGGINENITFQYKEHPVPEGDFAGIMISVKGLKGGHSGVDIHEGRGNSNKIINRFLYYGHYNHGLTLSSIDGGGLRNAIPRESTALVIIPSERIYPFMHGFEKLSASIKKELSAVEPTLQIEAKIVDTPKSMIDGEVFVKLIRAIHACPNGVIRMSNEVTGLVETSTNLANVKSKDGVITIQNMLRSSVDSAKEDLKISIKSVFDLAGAETTFDGNYPGWKPNPESPILKTMQDIYKRKFGNEPKIKAIHAGLECSILGGTYPDWDMISCGPTIVSPHSPDEKVSIPSVQKFWDYLIETLANIPVR